MKSLINEQVRKGLEGPAKDGETVTLEQIDTDDENDEVKQNSLKFPQY